MVATLALALAALWAGPPFAQAGPMTLDEAIGIALENSYSVRRARADVAKTRERVNEGYALMRPSLTGTFNYTRFDEETVAEFGSDGGSQSIVIQPKDRKSAQLTLNQPVDLVGRQKIGVSGAKAYESASRAGLTAEEATVVRDVKLAYLNVLRAESAVSIAKEAVDNSLERQRIAEAQVNAGTASRIDVLRAKTQVAQNRQLVIQAENGVSLAQSSFNNVLGRDVNAPVSLAPMGGLPEVATSLDTLIATAMESRPEVRRAELLVRFSREVVKLEGRGNMPSLNLSATVDYLFDTTVFTSRRRQIIGTAVLSFPIFDGNLTKARIGQARADRDSAEVSLEEAKQGVGLEVKQAYLLLQEARQRLDTAVTALAEAEEALRLAQLRYRNEVAIQLEVSDAELALTQARLNELNARFDYLDAYARLQRAIGTEELK